MWPFDRRKKQLMKAFWMCVENDRIRGSFEDGAQEILVCGDEAWDFLTNFWHDSKQQQRRLEIE